MSSNALILVGGSDTLQCDGTLIRPGVGLTMAQLMNAGGKVVTRVLNTGYKGPYNPKNHIQDFFSEGEARERALDELYKADRDDLTKQHKQLLKHCHALLEYALPECTIKTQLIAFKILVAVITRYPGIRWLFHHTKCYKKASPLTASHFENLWNRPHQQCGEEWTFYRDFAVYCLTDGGPLTKLMESELPSKFGQLKLLKHNWTKDPIESLLSFCSVDSLLNTEKLCAIRYLAGILELPKFWRLKIEEGIDIGKRLFGFLSRLCETIFQLIRDTEPSGSGHSEDDPPPLWTSARSAVDILAFATFSGFLQLHSLCEELPPCPSQLPSMVTLLERPQMERSFPKASGCALQCKEILTWQQDAGTNSLHVPPDGQSLPMPQSEQQNTETNSLHVPPDARSLLAPQSDVDGGPTEKHRQEEEHKAQHKSAQKKLKQAKETKVLICTGPSGSGKSQFIDSLTQKTKWAVESLVPQNHAVRPFKLEGSDLASTIILLDTPGFDGLFNSDVFEEVEKWLKSERHQNQVAGVLYFHNITDRHITVQPPFDDLKKLCGDNLKKVFFISTHWDRQEREPGKWNHNETELREGRWKPFLDSGAQTARFDKTTTTARQIAQMVLSSPSV